jgi:hypothetical protein
MAQKLDIQTNRDLLFFSHHMVKFIFNLEDTQKREVRKHVNRHQYL